MSRYRRAPRKPQRRPGSERVAPHQLPSCTLTRSLSPDAACSCVKQNPDGRSHATLRLDQKDLDPVEVTRRLGVEASEGWRRRDLVGNGTRGHRHQAGGWRLDTAWVDSDDLNLALTQLLDAIEPFAQDLMSLMSDGVGADVFT